MRLLEKLLFLGLMVALAILAGAALFASSVTFSIVLVFVVQTCIGLSVAFLCSAAILWLAEAYLESVQ